MIVESSLAKYNKVSRDLICKSIEELIFEEALCPVLENSTYVLRPSDSITYSFIASEGSWGNLKINRESLVKENITNGRLPLRFESFFIEFKNVLEIDDDTLTRYIEEGRRTIFSDMIYLDQIEKMDLSTLTEASFKDVDRLLPGHTKLIMNKGRIGWSENDIHKYSPEVGNNFQMRWLAVKRKYLDTGMSKDLDPMSLVDKSVFQRARSLKDRDYLFIPVHPWQWDSYIKIQFQELLLNGEMIDLGKGVELYQAQSSLRTLSSQIVGHGYDLKVSLSILNTSCVRGIPGKYIKNGHEISNFMVDLLRKDDFLNEKCSCLEEYSALRVRDDYFESLENASYRFHELLGCIWRESVDSKITTNEKALPTAGLLIENSRDILINCLIKKSGLSPEEWMTKYFEVVVLPLYHLQCVHGVGLVAHGQNTILVHDDGVPSRLIIKDFHGDLRLNYSSPHRRNKISKALELLPDHYLIHDLFTGHFITLLRFLSKKLDEEKILSEDKFYFNLMKVIQNYHNRYGTPKNDEVNLLKSKIEKVLVNRVRFAAGYSETSVRLKPMLGREIANPLLS